MQKPSELNPSLKGDAARRAVSSEPYAEETSWRRDCAGDCPKSRLSRGIARSSCLIGREREVGMVEDVEELRIEAKDNMTGQIELLRGVELGVREVRPTKLIAA